MTKKSAAKRSPEPLGTGKIEFNAQSFVKAGGPDRFPGGKEIRHKAGAEGPDRSAGGKERPWFTCDPEKIFPAVIARITQVLEDGEFPQELVDNNSQSEIDPRGVARQYLARAKKINPEAWQWALQDRGIFYKQEPIKERAAALDLARLWFTQALHVQVGGDGTPLGIHWLNRPAFRMS